MYDKFENNIQLAMQEIVFHPKRYEIWMNSSLIDTGKTTELIVFQPFKSEGKTLMKTNIRDFALHRKIMNSFDFDIFFTNSERLMLLTLPKNQEKNDCVGLKMFRLNMSPTRILKSFTANEPYCSSLFLIKGVINKVTFSFNYPERLIEFYSDDNDIEMESDFTNALNMLK